MTAQSPTKKKEKKLTECQLNFMRLVFDYTEQHGWPPSQREIGRQMKISSSATSTGYVTRLESIGMIEWDRIAGVRLTDKGLSKLLEEENFVSYQVKRAEKHLKKIIEFFPDYEKKVNKCLKKIESICLENE